MQGVVEEMGDVISYVEVDVSRDTATARKYGVQVVPTIIVLDSHGDIVETFVGTPGENKLRVAMEEAAAS